MESSLTVIDGVIIVFTILSAILAMARGITREVLGIASFLLAIFISTHLVEHVSPLLKASVDLYPLASKFSGNIDTVSSWITGGVLFIILWIIFTIITVKISNYVNDTAVSGIDSFLGFVFGLARGLYLLGIIYTMYTHFYSPEKYHESVAQAQLKPVLDKTAHTIEILARELLPEHIAQALSKKEQGVYTKGNTNQTNTEKTINKNDIVNIIKKNISAEKKPEKPLLPSNLTSEEILEQLEANGISTDQIRNAIETGKLPNNLTPEQILEQLQQ